MRFAPVIKNKIWGDRAGNKWSSSPLGAFTPPAPPPNFFLQYSDGTTIEYSDTTEIEYA